MDEQQSVIRNAVTIIDDKPYFELNAEEWAFPVETANPLKPIYFHMRPYTFEDMKSALKGLKTRIKDAGKTIISEEGDASAVLPMFDTMFIRMSNVVLTADDTEPPSVEQQKAWLDRNPRLKARVINEAVCMVFVPRNGAVDVEPGVLVNGKPADRPVVLDDLLSIDSTIGTKIDHLYRLHSFELERTVMVPVAHQFDVETPRDYSQYDRASRREIEKTSGYTSIDVDHDALNRLYDRTVLRLDGCLINGERCIEANKKSWLPRVPYYFKRLALDSRFEDITKKNN